MNEKKKTMYEILGVSQNASDSEIQFAYQQLSQKLRSEKNELNRERIDFDLKVVDVAFRTLSVQRTRDAYDARLAPPSAPANSASLSLVAIPSDAISLKAEAMSLKAEAMSLKADAVALRADALGLNAGMQEPAAKGLARFSSLLSPFKGAITILGTLVAIGLVVQVLFLLLVNRQAGQVASERSKSDEKVMLQEYYQEHGVRAGSMNEADMLEVERRREEQAQRERQEQERKYERFVEDARRQGERVSENLRMAEEEARREEERKKRQLEEEKYRQEEEDRLRHEREMARWRN